MGKGMYQWIKQSFDKGHQKQDGSFTAADFDYKGAVADANTAGWLTRFLIHAFFPI